MALSTTQSCITLHFLKLTTNHRPSIPACAAVDADPVVPYAGAFQGSGEARRLAALGAPRGVCAAVCFSQGLAAPAPGHSHLFCCTATGTCAVHAVRLSTVATVPAPALCVLVCATQAEEAISTGRQIARASDPLFSLNESSDPGPDAAPTSAAPSLSSPSGGRLSCPPIDADGPGVLEMQCRGRCGQA